MTKIRLENVHRDDIRELGEYEYVQLTYETLTVGPDGNAIAWFTKDEWWTLADGSQWSDVILYAA